MANGVEHLFNVLFCHSYICFGEVFLSFTQLKIVFLLLSFESSFIYILDTSPFKGM